MFQRMILLMCRILISQRLITIDPAASLPLVVCLSGGPGGHLSVSQWGLLRYHKIDTRISSHPFP